MPKLKEKYDVVIIGSGLGGLMCAYILCQEGRSVCVLEKNAQIGGNLQTFKRERTKFDSGVHYIGGMEKGQTLHSYFKYFNLLDNVDIRKLDENGFDRISFHNDDVSYPYAQGYENFIAKLSAIFPEEEENIRKYCKAMQDIVAYFELYNLDQDFTDSDELSQFGISAKEVINNCTQNKRLRNVLAGTNMLYAGIREHTPFYVHALILDSYIKSAYKMKFSDQISNHLRKDIRKMGGEIFVNAEVVRIHNSTTQAEFVELANGNKVFADTFVSNLHPTLTYKMLDTSVFRKVNVKRILNLENTVAPFIVYIKLKPKSLEFSNFNRYHFTSDEVWNLHEDNGGKEVKGVGVFNSPDPENPEFAGTLTLLAFTEYSEFEKWQHSTNTTLQETDRGADYHQYKEEKAHLLMKAVEKLFPNLPEQIDSFYTATPLTQRDYIGSEKGGTYGIMHDYNEPLKTLVKPNTKLKNFFLTGQNIILHGVLGVTIGAVVTCQHILGKKYLLDKIKKTVRED